MNTTHQQRHTISPRQIKAIHASINKIGMDDEDYRGILRDRYKVKSCKNLSWRQAEELLESLNGKRPSPPALSHREERGLKYTELDGRSGMCSGKQARMIAGMWAEVSRAATEEDRERALWVFMRRIVGVDHFRFLKGWQVQMVVKAISEMRKVGATGRSPVHNI